MKLNMIGMVLAAAEPAKAAGWFAEHFGFTVDVDLGWYVNTQHTGDLKLSLDFVQRDHESWPVVTRGRGVVGTLLAFVVDDVDAEHERLARAGLEVVLPLVTEPWGQRRFQVAGPDGVFVEVLQRVEPDPDWLAANGF
jgi:uncharacterized glyoxalase superfamily protein PhnB